MHQEDQADDGDDDAFLDQRETQGVDGAEDQFGAIVGRHQAHPVGQRELRDLRFERANHVERIRADAHHHNAADGFSAPFQSAAPRRISGPNCTVATSRSRIGVPPRRDA